MALEYDGFKIEKIADNGRARDIKYIIKKDIPIVNLETYLKDIYPAVAGLVMAQLLRKESHFKFNLILKCTYRRLGVREHIETTLKSHNVTVRANELDKIYIYAEVYSAYHNIRRSHSIEHMKKRRLVSVNKVEMNFKIFDDPPLNIIAFTFTKPDWVPF